VRHAGAQPPLRPLGKVQRIDGDVLEMQFITGNLYLGKEADPHAVYVELTVEKPAWLGKGHGATLSGRGSCAAIDQGLGTGADASDKGPGTPREGGACFGLEVSLFRRFTHTTQGVEWDRNNSLRVPVPA
jgi:hypothetical protein